MLADNAEVAAKSRGLENTLGKVTDINRIAEFGIMLTPGLAVNSDVKAFGRVLSPEKIRPLLED